MTYYCSQYDQIPASKYYTAERDSGEHICDYLLRLNGYARSANIHYEFGGRTGEQHVKHFLETCRDDALVEQLIPQRFDNIAKVEAVINDKLVAARRRKGLGRSSSKPSRDGSRRNDAGRRDDHRGDRVDRRGDGRSRRDDRYSRQVTLVDASVDELYEAWSDKMAITSRRRADSDDYERVSNHSDVSYRSGGSCTNQDAHG
ncbi:unnamed protein product [Phytophthora lilii]|uniref:Unnamed protein product n=1 Tax=Phytophthora lilii TaxID=2077276 RepID=A0A9W6YFU2_9STRA|nr:unnamed protein product [Phytophthora lilii]